MHTNKYIVLIFFILKLYLSLIFYFFFVHSTAKGSLEGRFGLGHLLL